MNDCYVILTGSKNNAGDFLIKHRAKALFASLRPDREIIDLDAWKAFDSETLERVNSARALILMGGPALQAHMHPGIYPLVHDLDQITVPVTTMGIGWKSVRGEWRDTHHYPLQPGSLRLLEKVADSGLACSVRDFHSLNVLNQHGIHTGLMTGCPAYYDLKHIGEVVPGEVGKGKVAFSLGVSFIESRAMEAAMKSQVLALRDTFRDQVFEVVFHHGLNPDVFLNTHGATKLHNDRHNEFARWLDQQGIAYVDISGSAENLMNYYSQVDLHIGYRVHAHIFMNSISRMSVMIAEDGRGKATEKVIGGMVLDAFDCFKTSLPSKVLNRLLPGYSRFVPNDGVVSDVNALVDYEILSQRHRGTLSRQAIDQNFSVMKRFLEQLP